MRRTRPVATLRRWLEALPDDFVRSRPVLSVGYAGAMLVDGEIEGVEDRLGDAERRLKATTGIRGEPQAPAGEVVFVDGEELRRLPGIIEVYRAALAQARGDVLDTVRHARSALELFPQEDHLVRASAAGLLGLASWAGGDLANAHRAYAECMTGLQQVGYASDALGCAIALADIRVAQGRLGEAMRTYQQALQLSPEEGGSVLRGTADMYVGMSQLHRERDELPAAAWDLLRSQELGEHTGSPQNRYRCQVAMARIREAPHQQVGSRRESDNPERLDRAWPERTGMPSGE
jgi:LuxR family maltose regulon positive regulatory protein